jgi:uncharacterized membrane protein YraQ (UPF0718 family)
MPRLLALVLIGVLLAAAIVYIVSKVSDALKGKSDSVWKVVILVVIAGGALWYFGNGLVYDYLFK